MNKEDRLVEIEKNLHDCFNAIDEAMKIAKVNKRLKSNINGYIMAILSNGYYLGKLNEDLSEWTFKYQGYGQ